MKLAARSLLLLVAFGATVASAQHVFQRVIIVVQENRTPDNLFQGLCAPPYGTCPNPYNISPTGVVILPPGPGGSSIPLTPATLYDTLNPDHTHPSFSQM